jgi:hypothetical protein
VRLPLSSAPTGSVRRLRFVGHCVGTTNVGSRVPGVPLFYMALCERGSLPQYRQAPPDQGADGDLSIYGRSHS